MPTLQYRQGEVEYSLTALNQLRRLSREERDQLKLGFEGINKRASLYRDPPWITNHYTSGHLVIGYQSNADSLKIINITKLKRKENNG